LVFWNKYTITPHLEGGGEGHKKKSHSSERSYKRKEKREAWEVGALRKGNSNKEEKKKLNIGGG